MTRALIVVREPADRARAAKWSQQAPPGTRIQFMAAKRTLDQNAKLWAALTDVAAQKEHAGHKYPTEIWKCLFMHACGHEVKFLPSLNEDSVVPLLFRSSDLSKQEMSDLIEFVMCWGTQNGVIFHDQEPPQ